MHHNILLQLQSISYTNTHTHQQEVHVCSQQSFNAFQMLLWFTLVPKTHLCFPYCVCRYYAQTKGKRIRGQDVQLMTNQEGASSVKLNRSMGIIRKCIYYSCSFSTSHSKAMIVNSVSVDNWAARGGPDMSQGSLRHCVCLSTLPYASIILLLGRHAGLMSDNTQISCVL